MKNGWMLFMGASVSLAAGLTLTFALARMHWNRQIARSAAALAKDPYPRAALNTADAVFQNLPPTVLLPGNGIAWTALDDGSARATLTDGGISVSLDFFFNPKGEIVRAFTASRFMDREGKAVPTPWECTYGNFAERDGFMVPLQGEAAWLLPEGRFSYYRAAVRQIGFDTEPR
jgi:uncharacterized protein DUF6544